MVGGNDTIISNNDQIIRFRAYCKENNVKFPSDKALREEKISQIFDIINKEKQNESISNSTDSEYIYEFDVKKPIIENENKELEVNNNEEIVIENKPVEEVNNVNVVNIQVDNPFLDLLKEQNLTKIKIDKELIPFFKIVISKISDYFSQNNLINVKDWKSFFNSFLLTNNNEQIYIKLGSIGENVEPIGGEYSKEKKVIAINQINSNSDMLCSSLCHEFIHFLVMHDSNSFNAKVSDSSFFNEGLTEYLSCLIMGRGSNSNYFRELEMAEFYSKITKNSLAFFLNNQFAFSDNYYTPSNLIRSSEKFQNDKRLDSYLNMQREIINRGLDDYNIDSFEDFVNIVTIINQRPRFDGEYIDYIFKKVVDKFIAKMNLSELQINNVSDKLIKFCKISNKYQLYSDNEVAEYLIEDLHIAFDKKGKHYNDFPSNGEHARGQTMTDMYHNRIEVIHRDKKYVIDITKMKCRNWKIIYDKIYNDLKKEFDLLNMKTIENGELKPNFKR